MRERVARRVKEFDLDAPTLGNDDRHAFRLQTRFLTANVERHFRAFSNSAGIWKVLVEVVPKVTREKARNLLGVLVIEVAGDPGIYLTSKRGERERLALEWLLTGVRVGFAEHGWSPDSIDGAIACVIAENYRNVWFWKKALFNRSHTASVDVAVEHDDKEARIVAMFRPEGSDFSVAATLCSTPPTEFSFTPCLGQLTWLDDDTIQLTSRSGSTSWRARRSAPR